MNKAHYIDAPRYHRLELFARIVIKQFDAVPHLVGSSLLRPDWRDVDIRLILSDEDFAKWSGGEADEVGLNRPLTMAFSALGREITGLPIDFQIQRMGYANESFGDGRRSAIGLIARHFCELDRLT